MSRRTRRRPSASSPASSVGAERLQKVLAAAGVGSRRECEELIVTGRVEVDGQAITELGTRVDPTAQEIRVDGVAMPRPRRVYYALNKPPGVVCSNRDPSGRLLAVDMVRSDERLFTVGRLDRTSEGLILITNDGALANRLTHPRYEVEKRYLVRVVGSPNPEILTRLRRGVHLAEGFAKVSDIRVRSRSPKFTDMEIALREGRNREVRRLLARVGHKVVRLKRIAIGPLKLGPLPVGESRALTREEVSQLQQPVDRTQRPSHDRPPRPARSGGAPSPGARHGSPSKQPSPAGQSLAPRPSPRPARPPHPSRPPQPARVTKPPVDEPDELIVEEGGRARPTGAVLAFDDAESAAVERPVKKKRR